MKEQLRELALAVPGPILVTGVNGFIGASLFRTLVDARPDVCGVARRIKHWRLESLQNPQVALCDITDVEAVRDLVSAIKPKTTFHLAAYGAYPSQRTVPNIFNVNVTGAANLVETLGADRSRTLITAGSSSEYGSNSAGPSEDGDLRPNSFYSISKGTVSQMLRTAVSNGSLRGANLRIYSAYGPLETTSRLVPVAVREALRGRYPPFADSSVSRDFVYIDDVVRAFLLAAIKVSEGRASGDFNIGTGVRTTLEDFASALQSQFAIAKPALFGSMENRDWDLNNWFSEPKKARELLGWSSTMTLNEGLQLTADWVKGINDSHWEEYARVE